MNEQLALNLLHLIMSNRPEKEITQVVNEVYYLNNTLFKPPPKRNEFTIVPID